MNRMWFGIFALIVSATTLFSLGCGYNQHLVSIQVIPPGATFGSVGASIVFKALGTYEHPPQTKDITDIVTWSVDSQNLVVITDTSDVTAINICGSGNLYAKYYDSPNEVIGSAFLTGGGVGNTQVCPIQNDAAGAGGANDSTAATK